MKVVPVFFATNDKYCAFCGVTIASIIDNASENTFFDVKVLYSELSYSKIKKFEGLSNSKCKIKCVDVSAYIDGRNYYDGVTNYTNHITKETFYRLLIPEIFSELDRIIYLDCDLVVCADLTELYETELEGKTIGAVYSVEQWEKDNKGFLPNDDPHEWFNAGVMVIDIKKYNEKGYAERCREELAKQVFDVGDQDLLRLVCYGDVHYLPFEWNVMWHHIHNGGYGLKDNNRFLYNAAKEAPKIVHYSGNVKPWNIPNTELSDYFFRYAKKTPFYDEIVNCSFTELRNKDKNKVVVSIIIPVYNAEHYLRKTLDSVLNQTYADIEIICVDDGSTDSSLSILAQYASKDERLRIIHQENSGAGIARNLGMNYSDGSYVFFLDADDYLENDAIEKISNYANDNDADIVIFGAYRLNNVTGEETKFENIINKSLLPDQKVFCASDLYDHIFELSYGYVWTKIYKKEFLVKNDIKFQEIRNCEATAMVYLSMCLASRITYLDEYLIHYRMENTFGASMQSEQYPVDIIKAWKHERDELVKRNLYHKVRRSFINIASEHILNKFWIYNSYNAYKQLFLELKKDELDLLNHEEEYFNKKDIYNYVEMIRDKSFEEFAFDRCMYYKKAYKNCINKKNQKNYNRIPKDSTIILYGAGKRGTRIYIDIITDKYCTIILWVDKNADKMMPQVRPVNEIMNTEGHYDYIAVGVKDYNMYTEIRAELIELGVEESRIIQV